MGGYWSVPPGVANAVKITHDFDQAHGRAWVQVDIDAQFPGRRSLFLGAGLAASLALAACGGSSSSSSAGGSTSSGNAGGGGNIGVSLITKDSTNPFFVSMQQSAKTNCPKDGADIKVGSGKAEGDDEGQIQEIESAIASQKKGILITPMSTGVNDAISKARDAGL